MKRKSLPICANTGDFRMFSRIILQIFENYEYRTYDVSESLKQSDKMRFVGGYMKIIQVTNDEEKKAIAKNILEELPEWFGIPEAREEYIRNSAGKTFFCAEENEKAVGFLYLKQTGKDTVELAVIGVLKEYHRK